MTISPANDALDLRTRLRPFAYVAIIVAAWCAAALQLDMMLSGTFSTIFAWGIAAVQTVPLVVANTRPLVAWQVITVGMVCGALSGFWQSGEVLPWTVAACLCAVVSLLVLAARAHPDRAWIWGGVGIAASMVSAAIATDTAALGYLYVVATGVVVLTLGTLLGTVRRTRADADAQRAAVEKADRDTALVEERNRIARELHDVVAHHVSMIAIQAQAAQVNGALDERTEGALANIHAAATTAVNEMRTVVDGMWASEEVREPEEPSVGDIADLVERCRSFGVTVELTCVGLDHSGADIRQGVAAAAYRIVQESVTNAVRHAEGEPVVVSLRRRDRELSVEVVNNVDDRRPESGREGKGIVGMRERVRVFGGDFRAEEVAGKFVVHATFPLAESNREEIL